MRRNYKGNALLTVLLVLVMLLCSFPTVYAKDAATEIFAAEQESVPKTEVESIMAEEEPETESEPVEVPEEEPVAESELMEVSEEAPEAEPETEEVPEEGPVAEPETEEAPEEEPEAEPETAEIPEEEPIAEPETVKVTEEESAAEPETVEVPEEEPETEPETEEVPEEESAAEPESTEVPEAETEEEADEEASEDTLYEFDDDEVGSVSEELLEIFNNPDLYEKVEFTGTVNIELKNSEICYDQDVTLVARVTGADMDYRLVWEANDGNGWFAVASGSEYTFLLTPEIATREYRVILFRVC